MEDKNKIIEILKNTSFMDIVLMAIENNVKVNSEEQKDIYYTAKDLINLYPNIFSKYKLDKYIKYDNLPVIKDGKERYFLKSNVDMWLKRKNEESLFKRSF